MATLHSAIKYEVEYGLKSNFNWQNHVINPIIAILAEEQYSFDGAHNGEELENASTVTANRINLLKNIDKIISPDENWDYQEMLEGKINLIEVYHDISREELHKNLKELIEQSDSRNKDVFFAWF